MKKKKILHTDPSLKYLPTVVGCDIRSFLMLVHISVHASQFIESIVALASVFPNPHRPLSCNKGDDVAVVKSPGQGIPSKAFLHWTTRRQNHDREVENRYYTLIPAGDEGDSSMLRFPKLHREYFYWKIFSVFVSWTCVEYFLKIKWFLSVEYLYFLW